MTLASKVARKLGELLIRKRPWQVHFFYETRNYRSVHDLLSFFLRGESLLDGPYIREYENRFEGLLDPNGWAISFGAARMALYSILEALDIGEGDEVIIPAFTCEVVVHALLYRKIVPVYADVDPRTYNLDVRKLESRITPKTKAVLAQHTFGIPCDLDEILRLSEVHDFQVIEDCAVALGATYRGKPVGTFGHAAIFSTDWTKVTSTVLGGMAYTRSPDLAKKLKKIYDASPSLSALDVSRIALLDFLSPVLLAPRAYFWSKYLIPIGIKAGIFFDFVEDKTEFRTPDRFPCRLSNFQAFLGITQLKNLRENLEIRKKAVEGYLEVFHKKGIRLGWESATENRSLLRFAFPLKNRDRWERKWIRYFEMGKWFDSPALGWYDNFEKIYYRPGSCPEAEKLHRSIANFPTHQTSVKFQRFLKNLLSELGPEDIHQS